MQRARSSSLIAVVSALLLSASVTASAQPGGDAAATPTVSTSAAAGSMDQPIGQLTLPVEVAALSNNVGLQFGYTRADLLGAGVNVLSLALDAQIALYDRIEVGLNVPFLLHGWVSGLGQVGDSDTAFGNLQINLKAKLAGDSAGPWAVAVYANTTLPTTSADLPERGFAMLHTGLAATGKVSMATFGGATGVYTLLNGTDSLGGGDSMVLYTADLFASVRLHRMVAVQLAMQLGVPIEPSGGEVAFALTPALQIHPTERVHVDVGSRIGVTDNGKGYAGGGRASLVFSAGYNF